MHMKKQIVGSYWSWVYFFAQIFKSGAQFWEFLLFQKSWGHFRDWKGAIFGILFKNKQNLSNFFFVIVTKNDDI